MADCNVCGFDYYGYKRGRDPENQIYECFVCNGIVEREVDRLGEIEHLLTNESLFLSDVRTFTQTVKKKAQAFHCRIDADIPVLLYAFVIETIIRRFIKFYMLIKKGMEKRETENKIRTSGIMFICEGSGGKDKKMGIYEEYVGKKFSKLVREGGFSAFPGNWEALKNYRDDFAHNYKPFPFKKRDSLFWEPARRGFITKLDKKIAAERDRARKAALVKKFRRKFKEYKETDIEKARVLTEEAFDVFIYLWNNYIKGAKKGK